MQNVLMLCSSPLISLRLSIYIESKENLHLDQFRALESMTDEQSQSFYDFIIVVATLRDFDITARVASIKKQWPNGKIILITEVEKPQLLIYRRKVINDVVYFYWHFQSAAELKELIENDLKEEFVIHFQARASKVHLTTPTSKPTLKPVGGLDRLKPSIVLVGASTGGFAALRKLVSTLPKEFRSPIVIAQHIPKGFDQTLLRTLNPLSHMSVKLAEDGLLQPKHIYIAPYDYHVHLLQDADGRVKMVLSQEAPEHSLRPAVDPLFRSAASITDYRIIAAILTGMGSDGTEGGKDLFQAGGKIICQDEKSSSVWGMPRMAYEAGLCYKILALDQIANELYILSH